MQKRIGSLILMFVATAAANVTVAAEPSSVDRHFELRIRPLLETKCLKCHGPQKQEGHLRLDSRAAMLKGGETGPAVVAGNPDDSLLIEAVKHGSLEMPPDGPLSPAEIQHLSMWVAAGAVWPEGANQLRAASGDITAADREWWAFQPLSKPAVPLTPGDEWSHNPIDRFVLDRMSQDDLRPAPPADKVTLVRRLYFDLIGLPPTPEEVDAFLADDSADAWELLIENLLADNRYGEHWARFWLDLVRYAESDGWKADTYRPHIWRYRDYVVSAFNEDKPYPQFVKEQLAGDELSGDDPTSLAAAGFLRLGIFEYNQRDARRHWSDIIDEITDVTGDVFLGMGMACARCHDHKFDPLLQQDYYRLRAFFEPLLWRDVVTADTDEQQAERESQQTDWREATQDVRARLDALTKPHYARIWEVVFGKFPLDIQACDLKPAEERTSWDQQMSYLIKRQFAEEGGGPRPIMTKEEQDEYDRLLAELSEFDHLKPQPVPVVMTVADFQGAISPTVIPNDASEATVEPGFLTVLSHESASSEPTISLTEDSTGRRLVLASWIGRADNPLTTRVIVNRVWQQHFGKGIVPTTSDFGHLGQEPSHPELLDWLTVTFIEHGWSMKDLHRMILTSATWRQSSDHPQAEDYQQRDPAGDLMWRARVRRLTAEQIRDALLTATGEQDRTLGGPSVAATSPRRSLYVKCLRNTPDEFLNAFDMAGGFKSVAERYATTTPTQSLLMLNGSYSLNRAQALSRRLLEEDFQTYRELMTDAFRRTWNRVPTDDELTEAIEFVGTSADLQPSSVDPLHLTDFCHVLLNSNEFLYVD